MHIVTFDNTQDFIDNSTSYITEEITQSSEQRFYLGLSGGNTPRPIYAALALQWGSIQKDIHIFQIDERYIPTTDARSNQNMISQTILRNNPKNVLFHPMQTELCIPDLLEDYEQQLRAIPTKTVYKNSELPILDLSILGIGPDGHIASLFPHLSVLDESRPLVAHTTTDQFDIHDRITLTYPPIIHSRKILILISGANKTGILNQLQDPSGDFHDFPAKKLWQHPDCTLYFNQSDS